MRPIPPKICTASSVALPSISVALSFAMATSSEVIVPWSSFQAAFKVNSSAAAISVAMSASLNEVPWKRPMGWPNWRRVAAHSAAISSTR